MATLTGKKISESYKDLLQISNNNSGVDGTLRDVSDGEGTVSVLQISSDSINIKDNGAFQINETPVTSTATELNYLDGADTNINTLTLPASTTISAFGASVIDDADASTARSTMGVDAAGTDNSTNVTLAGKDYIVASGTNNQTLTLGTVDISDDTNLVGGTGVTLTGDTLSTVDSEIDHDSLNNYSSDKHIAHSFVTLTAGAGLTGGGDITTSRDFAVGAGTGITVNANDVAVDTSVIATRNYVDGQVSTVNTLGEMTDVSFSSLGDDNLLQYNSASSEWNNTSVIDGGEFTT
jgi:hypothetical protein